MPDKKYYVNMSESKRRYCTMLKVRKICKHCGRIFEVTLNRIKTAKFCSISCIHEYRKEKGRAIRICKHCKKEFTEDISAIKNGRCVFCSNKCYSEWRREHIRGKNHPSWRGGKVKRICKQCGKEFKVNPSRIKVGKGKFCSIKCYRKWQLESDECKENMMRARKQVSTKPTKPEIIFKEICEKNDLPFKYTSNKEVWIGKRPRINPDFIECNGKKIAIFINGDYWHSPLLRYNIRESQRADVQVRICKQHKWIPVIIWQSDILRKDAEQFILSELKKGGVFP